MYLTGHARHCPVPKSRVEEEVRKLDQQSKKLATQMAELRNAITTLQLDVKKDDEQNRGIDRDQKGKCP